MLNQTLEPEHYIEYAGARRRLRYRFVDWMKAERALGRSLRTDYGIPEPKTTTQFLSELLFIGLAHDWPNATIDSVAEHVGIDEEEALTNACIRALYDYMPRCKANVEQTAKALEGATEPGPLLLKGMCDLMMTIIGTSSIPSEESGSDSQSESSGPVLPEPLNISRKRSKTA